VEGYRRQFPPITLVTYGQSCEHGESYERKLRFKTGGQKNELSNSDLARIRYEDTKVMGSEGLTAKSASPWRSSCQQLKSRKEIVPAGNDGNSNFWITKLSERIGASGKTFLIGRLCLSKLTLIKSENETGDAGGFSANYAHVRASRGPM
jgi:hypothetical protein